MKITRKGKRILSLLLAIVLLVSMVPSGVLSVFSQEVGQQETHPDIGKVAKLITFTSGKAYSDLTNAAYYTIVSSAAYPKRVVITGVQVVKGVTYYQLSAAENYEWPSFGPGDGYWLESAKVEIVQLCDKCGAEDCEKVHVFCPYCDTYDCPLEHNDPYQPYVAPVIPANPTLTPGADVSLADEYGNAVTSSIVLNDGKKYSLSAWPKLSGNVTYQWQVCYNNAKMLWVDLYGQTEKGILLSAAMIRSLVDAQDLTYVRCVASNGSGMMTSDPIPVILDETSQKNITVSDVRFADGGTDGAQTVEDEVKHSIIIKYVMKVEGVEAPSPWVVYLAPGENYVVNVKPDDIAGFYAGDAAGERMEYVNETITDIRQDHEITVYYWPDYTKYKVQHYQQKVGDDSYELFAEETFDKKLKTGDPVGNKLAKSYIGFESLPYDTTITVAADGSTVVKIYYDRQYYMIAIDLNGGYGAEPIYARYETPISIPDPKRTGYVFDGWVNLKSGQKESIVATMPMIPEEDNYRITYQAQWERANTNFTVAVWYENADDTDYTFVGSVQLEGLTGSTVSGSAYAGLNKLDSAEHFDGFNADYAQHFETLNADKTDKNVFINADGSTVVNVYFYRNKYQLAYYQWNCVHDHSSGCTYCSTTEHTHTTGCIAHGLTEASNSNQNWLNNNTSNRYDGMLKDRNSAHYVYFGGTWYRKSGFANEFDEIEWNCNGTGGQVSRHTHSASCCTHDDKYDNCTCRTNGTGWIELYNELRKYEEDVSATHKTMQNKTTGYRWVDMYFGGKATGENYGSGGAMGTFTSMPGGKTVFYQGSYNSNSTLFEMQYWLETYDGDVSGTRYYDGRWFKKNGEPFYTRMSYVAWNGDYVQGLPAGYEVLDCTFGDTADNGGVEDPYKNSLKEATQSKKKYNNYYYTRESFKLVYINYGKKVAETTLMYDQPLTTEHDIRILTSADSPFGAGYYFAGWYLDPEGTVPVDWNNTSMPDGGNTGDIGMSVYAKWLPIGHDVNVYLTKEDMLAGKLLENWGPYKIFHGEMYEGTVAIPNNGGLTFIGWFYEEDGKEVAYDFSMPVYRNMNLYAKWNSSVVTYGTIYYEDIYGNKLAEPIRVTGMVGDTKTYNAKFSAELGDGTTLYFPDTTSHNIKFTANPDQNVHVFVYKALPEVKYTIKFVNKDNPSQELFPAVSDSAKTATISYTSPAKDKWYVDKNSKEFALSSDESKNVFYFYYTYDPGKATVQVEHYIERLNGSGYDFHSETPATVEALETLIKAADRKVTINGFTYSYAEFNGTVATQQILNGGLTIKLYYSRNSYDYTFRFVYTNAQGQEVEFANSAVTGTAKYRANIVQEAKRFPGYEADSGAKSIIVDYNENNNIYTFYYTEKGVDIRYSVGAVKGGSISSTGETVNAITGTPVGSTATVNSNGKYTFTGWYTDYNCTEANRVSTNATFSPSKNDDGIHVSRTYYAGFKEAKATIHYEVKMPDGAAVNATLLPSSEQVDMVTGIANGSMVDTIPDGYAFDGWYDANGNLLSKESSFKPNRPADGWAATQTFYAKFVQLHTITWNYGYNGITDTTKLVHGSIVLAPDHDPVRDGYTFLGWYTDAEFTTKYVFGQKLTQDVILYAKWERSFTSLTIDVVYPNGADYAIDGDQAFLFEVIGVDDGVNLTVSILKDGKAVIDGLTIDKVYTVKWDAAWSWRYNINEGTDIDSKNVTAVTAANNSVTFTLGVDGVLTFTVTRVTDQWLDGNDYYSSN